MHANSRNSPIYCWIFIVEEMHALYIQGFVFDSVGIDCSQPVCFSVPVEGVRCWLSCSPCRINMPTYSTYFLSLLICQYL